jgi:uncharacterized protein with FMN-binding domain
MRRIVLTLLSTVAGFVLLLSLKPHQSAPPVVAARPPSTSPSTSSSSSPSSSSKQPSSPTSGTFTGSVIDTRYGPVQVSATVKNGKLTAVQVLQVPSGNGRDQEIAAYSIPRLTQAALVAQSAHIDSISGASYTSEGYIQSLQSALDQAGV